MCMRSWKINTNGVANGGEQSLKEVSRIARINRKFFKSLYFYFAKTVTFSLEARHKSIVLSSCREKYKEVQRKLANADRR